MVILAEIFGDTGCFIKNLSTLKEYYFVSIAFFTSRFSENVSSTNLLSQGILNIIINSYKNVVKGH